jgi:hypothetical protein
MPYLSHGSTIPAQILSDLEGRAPGFMGIVAANAARKVEFSCCWPE